MSEPESFEPEFFSFDKYRLDEELVAQPKFYFEHAALLADTRRDYEQAKAKKDLIYAKLYHRIKSNPQAYGLDKATEESIKQTIIAHEKYQAMVARLIEAEHLVDKTQAGVTALDHRKRALEKAVELFLSGYWAEPRVKGSSSGYERAVEEDKKRTRTAGQKKRMDRDDS